MHPAEARAEIAALESNAAALRSTEAEDGSEGGAAAAPALDHLPPPRSRRQLPRTYHQKSLGRHKHQRSTLCHTSVINNEGLAHHQRSLGCTRIDTTSPKSTGAAQGTAQGTALLQDRHYRVRDLEIQPPTPGFKVV